MPLRSTPTRYGAVAIAFHWVTAAAILVLLPLGLLIQGTEGETRVLLYTAHLSLGLLVLVTTLLRACWRLVIERGRPAHLPGPSWQGRAARAAHGLLYVAMIVLAVSGIGMITLSGAGPALFEGGIAPAPGDFDALPPRALHGAAALVLAGLLVLHVAAAVWHHRVVGDETLARILPVPRRARAHPAGEG